MAIPVWIVKLLTKLGIAGRFRALADKSDGAIDFLRYYSDRTLASPVDDLRLLSAIMSASAPDVIDLSQAAPRRDRAFSLSARVATEPHGPAPGQGLTELRRAISDLLFRDEGISTNPEEEVLVTHGASGAIASCLDAFVNPGSRVVLFAPSSPLFALALRARRARIAWIQTWVETGRLRFPAEALSKAMRGARMLLCSDPTNPTGAVLAPEDLEQIVWWANRYDVLLVQDLSFSPFQYEGDRCRMARAAPHRSVSIGSLGIGYGLPSLRIGWLAGHRHLVRPGAMAQLMSAPFVASPSQRLAVAALNQPLADLAAVRSELASRRLFVLERIQGMGLTAEWPAGGCSLWTDVSSTGLTGFEFTSRLMERKRVRVCPGMLFGPGSDGQIRIGYAAEEGRLLEGMARLAEFVSELRGPIPAPVKPCQDALNVPTPAPNFTR